MMRAIFLLLLLVTVVSCTKNLRPLKGSVVYSPTAKMIMNKKWLEADVFVEMDSLNQDITTQFPKPERDDILVLNEDGTYDYDEGETKVAQSHKQVFVSGTWKMNEGDTEIHLTANGSTNIYEIVNLTESTLILRLAVTMNKKHYSYRLHFISAE